MKQSIFKLFEEFCTYLDNWEEKKDYYINEFLPQIFDFNFKGLNQRARQLFLDIWKQTSLDEWKDGINIIVQIKENPNKLKYESLDRCLKIFKSNYGFEGFIHSTNFDNFIRIMKSKELCSRDYLLKNGISFSDIANQNIVTQQENLRKYVRFYFRCKTPTNYRNEGIKSEKSLNKKDIYININQEIKEEENNKAHSAIPVILIFDAEIAKNDNCRYKAQNRMNEQCKNSIFQLREYWDYIFENDSISFINKNYKQFAKYKMAEFLYPEKISTNYIVKIIFRSICDKERAIQILGENSLFDVDNSYFCNNYLYPKEYEYKNNILSIIYNFGENLEKDNVTINDYEHKVCLFKHGICIKEISNFKFIYDNGQITIPQFINFDYLCYYINNIECIRIYND